MLFICHQKPRKEGEIRDDVRKCNSCSYYNDPGEVAGGAPLFTCESTEELEFVANNLEAILDGIAHRLQENVYIIVKH